MAVREMVAVERAPAMGGEALIAGVLRAGALASGALFLASLGLGALPGQEEIVEPLRQLAVLTLVSTPMVRVIASGVLLGLRGEYRYAAYAAFVLALLGVALAAGQAP